MTAEEAMRQIDQILTEYFEVGGTEFNALAKIARVSGKYEGSKP